MAIFDKTDFWDLKYLPQVRVEHKSCSTICRTPVPAILNHKNSTKSAGKSRYFRYQKSILPFHTFLALFGLLYGPFFTLFNTKISSLVLLGKKFRKPLANFPLRGGGTLGQHWLLKQFCLNHPVEHIQKPKLPKLYVRVETSTSYFIIHNQFVK